MSGRAPQGHWDQFMIQGGMAISGEEEGDGALDIAKEIQKDNQRRGL